MSKTPQLPLDAAQARAVDLLRSGKRFVLCGHMRPDGDCLGSETALARVLASVGKEVWIYNPDAHESRYDYLAADVRFRPYTGGALPEHDVAVLLDFCELARTGTLEAPLRAASSKKLVVDHHMHHGAAWWDEAFVDVTAAATGMLVHRIAGHLGVALDAAAARGVFTSIVTDTGWFKYSNTDASAIHVASEMIAAGVDASAVYSALYQRRSAAHPRYVAQLLARLEYFADGRLAVVDMPLELGREAAGVDSDEVLDILRSVERVEVVLYLREQAEGGVKLSARSKTTYDVNALARAFGGGGHKKASGATIPGRLAEVRERVITAAVAGFDRPAEVQRAR